MVQYFDEASVRAALSWDPLIAAMEGALATFSSGQGIQTVRNMITIEEDKRYLGIMPAVAREAMGLPKLALERDSVRSSFVRSSVTARHSTQTLELLSVGMPQWTGVSSGFAKTTSSNGSRNSSAATIST